MMPERSSLPDRLRNFLEARADQPLPSTLRSRLASVGPQRRRFLRIRELATIAVVAAAFIAALGGARLLAQNSPSRTNMPATSMHPSLPVTNPPGVAAPTTAAIPTFSAGPVWTVDRLTFFGSSGWAEEIIANTGESPNRLFHTNDGGAHWTEVTLAHCTGCGVMGVVFATSTTMISIAAPSGGGLPVPVEVAVTHDGGRTWHHMTLGAAMDVWSARGGFSSDGTYGLLTFENFHGSQSLGQTQVWSTSDGGARWHKVADGAPAGDVEVVTSRLAFIAVTQQDSLERSTDGGATWHPVLQGALSAPHFSDNTHGSVLVGQYDQAYSLSSVALYRTSNGGSTWQAGARLVDPSLANDGAGTGLPAWAGRGSAEAVLVIGEDVWVTNDGGSTWSQTATGVSIAASALAIAPNGIMFAADFGETCPGKTNCVSFAAFLASSDGGHTWKDVHQP